MKDFSIQLFELDLQHFFRIDFCLKIVADQNFWAGCFENNSQI